MTRSRTGPGQPGPLRRPSGRTICALRPGSERPAAWADAWPAISVKESYLRARFLRLKARRGVKKGIVAIAADILRAVFFILTRNTPYRDLGAAFFDRLDTTKATANLVRRLRALGYDVNITPAA